MMYDVIVRNKFEKVNGAIFSKISSYLKIFSIKTFSNFKPYIFLIISFVFHWISKQKMSKPNNNLHLQFRSEKLWDSMMLSLDHFVLPMWPISICVYRWKVNVCYPHVQNVHSSPYTLSIGKGFISPLLVSILYHVKFY